MRKLVFIVAFAAFSFVATEASAATVINTSQDEVKKQCEGRTNAARSVAAPV